MGVKARGGKELGVFEDCEGWSERDGEAAAAPEFSPTAAAVATGVTAAAGRHSDYYGPGCALSTLHTLTLYFLKGLTGPTCSEMQSVSLHICTALHLILRKCQLVTSENWGVGLGWQTLRRSRSLSPHPFKYHLCRGKWHKRWFLKQGNFIPLSSLHIDIQKKDTSGW